MNSKIRKIPLNVYCTLTHTSEHEEIYCLLWRLSSSLLLRIQLDILTACPLRKKYHHNSIGFYSFTILSVRVSYSTGSVNFHVLNFLLFVPLCAKCMYGVLMCVLLLLNATTCVFSCFRLVAYNNNDNSH